jgi:hypothetical protein
MSVTVEFTDEEFAALYAALDPQGHYAKGLETIDWAAYDAAKARVLETGRALEAADQGRSACA